MSKNRNELSVVRGNKPSSKLILVLDDYQDMLELFESVLTGEGYRVSLQDYNGRNLQKIKQIMPDLIISDHSLKDQDANWRFLQELKMDKQTQDIPVIICTAILDVAQDNGGHLAKLGIKGLSRPFKLDELLSLIRKMLN